MQKEKLSALMDGETLDSELLNALTHDPEMQKTWESYHLIRDSMRGDTPDVLHFDISARVMAAIENDPVRQVSPLIPEAQPAPQQWQKMPFWKKVRPWAAQLTQVGGGGVRFTCSYRRRPAL
ncbi:anti-RNA polymerase sigma factor SigE [Salmonella enterica subsp. arizonae]|uniref:Anti-RNA polymerase sigma factor SigE n=1 Tax=Salmonella enterica subsp. arizonae TaxID=59203 RepID=A0A379T831_SALER|nr:anti-RNA polymerase sigma factor SigE [Salmonella enterica subsp. arizonae]